MNDNVAPLLRLDLHHGRATQDGDLALLRAVAARAITKPESLTMGEIRDVGWAFLMASKELTQRARHF